MNTFYQLCIYITVSMVLFTVSVSFVSALGVFNSEFEQGVVTGDKTNETFLGFTVSPDNPGGVSMTNIWLMVLTGTGVGGLVIAWITRSTSILGVYLFSVVFWSAYINTLNVINVNNFLSDIWGFVMIGTVGMVFIFVGAIAGMLSGSG